MCDLSPPDPNKRSFPAHWGLLQLGEVSVKVWFLTLQTAVGFSSGIRIIRKEMVPIELHIHACTMKAENKAKQNTFLHLVVGPDERCCHNFWMTGKIPQDDERSAKRARLSLLGTGGTASCC